MTAWKVASKTPELAQACKETLCHFVGEEESGLQLASSFSQSSFIILRPPPSLPAKQI